MNSILSRFRSRAISQTTTDSTLSAESPVTPTNLIPEPHVAIANVQRKIYPQVDSLFEEYASEPSELLATPRPSPVRYPSSPKRYSTDDLIMNALSPRRAGAPLPADHASQPQPSRPPSSASARRHSRLMSGMSIVSTAGRWSTFGRRKQERSHGQAEIGDQPSAWNARNKGKERASSSTRSSAGTSNNRSQPSAEGMPGSRSTSKPPSSHSSHTQTMHADVANKENSASTTPSTPGRPHSHGTPASHSSAHISTPAARQLGFDSPRTFGYPTPQTGSDNHASGAPPLPPLDHPAFATSLLDRTNEDHDARTPPSHPQTYPRDSRGSIVYGGEGEDRMSTSFSFGKGIRPYRSMPKANQVFSSPSKYGSTRSRSRTRTESHRRRTSADYFSQQASAAPSVLQQDWPSRVAQELVRLALSEETPRVRNSRSASAIAAGGAGTGHQTEHKAPATCPRIRDNLRSLPPSSSSPFPSSSSPRNLASAPYPLPAPAVPHRRTLVSLNDASRSAGPDTNSSTSLRAVRSFLSRAGTTDAGTPGRMMQDSGDGNGSERGGRSGLTALATPKKALRSSLKPKSPIASTSRGTGENPAALASSPVIGAGPSYLSPISAYQTPVSSPSATAKGKRKAEEVDITPPDQKGAAGAPHHRATFAVPEPRGELHASVPFHASSHSYVGEEDAHRPGSFSRAPSAYPHRKRARLSEPSPVHSRPGSAQAAPNAQNTGTYSSRASSRAARDASMRSADGLAPSERELARRRSLSQASIPLSALVTPHAPSLSRSSAFHMRDPRRPPKKLETGWALRVRSEEEEGSPVQAWLFYVAFVLFPLWWVASVWRTPRTREVGGTDTEKAVTLDDPQIEFDAKSWRFRCRVMAVVSLFTYIPFIVLVAIFAGR